MDFNFLGEYSGFFFKGAKFTLILAFFTVIIGSLIGLLLSLMKLSNKKILKFISSIYIEFIRGTPVLVQLYIIYYGLPAIGIELPDLVAATITMSINSGAYVAEIIRAGINAVDKGQTEAARSLGMGSSMTMANVIIPQAFKNILPALGNEFIVVVKESSIVSVIGIHELMYNANTVRGTTFQPFEPLIVAALFYFVITFTLSKLLGIAERRMKISDTN
ncbi:amino acid ABC transporter permease [Clostridium algidicarnis]|uniref:Amino acid ABC transporter permease n=1 Tax=Clostridium algidicarnis TaxID=37659 RepID=A0ABS6C4Y3_9CLOT|nr:amino acid ABC transporter permease [Clostridium algidicarnis]MBB6632101.1 amino acid ABC transporter permease [Clostridium algidicarnis]MBU3220546.1 amino acid ABC transporter permease [Clostridium algidicarnis]MCB2286705.1 amino acid ABC transporter permease [Clostridium algidicarnis]